MTTARLPFAASELPLVSLLRRSRGDDSLSSRLFDRTSRPLHPALAASRHDLVTADGTLSYYADLKASGRPLVLLHGVHAAASAYEMRPLFEAFRGKRKIYALDLPGFGFSDRGARTYTPETYVRAIEHLLRHAASREPADVIALSLTSEYVAKVAIEMPELIRSLTFISPTGQSIPVTVRYAIPPEIERMIPKVDAPASPNGMLPTPGRCGSNGSR